MPSVGMAMWQIRQAMVVKGGGSGAGQDGAEHDRRVGERSGNHAG